MPFRFFFFFLNYRITYVILLQNLHKLIKCNTFEKRIYVKLGQKGLIYFNIIYFNCNRSDLSKNVTLSQISEKYGIKIILVNMRFYRLFHIIKNQILKHICSRSEVFYKGKIPSSKHNLLNFRYYIISGQAENELHKDEIGSEHISCPKM